MMEKIISLFQRNYDGDRLVRDEVVPGAEWVVAGEGVATRKWDGTCCKVECGKLFKRYDAKRGRTPPVGFIPAQEDPDEVTGHWPGWLPVGIGPADMWHIQALLNRPKGGWADGTYELCGPKIGGNPEKLPYHVLIRHGTDYVDAPRTFDALREWFKTVDLEGVVWWHPDGRKVKIKARDFGLKRGCNLEAK
jgi:hypothetical protein